MAALSPNAKQQFFDNAGAPADGCLLYTYATGTTTPLATYTNRAGTSANANPIVLDARGEATVYLLGEQEYRFVLKSADGLTTFWTRDNIASPTYEVRTDLASTASDKGAALVGFKQSSSGAVERTVAQKLGEHVSILDFGGVGDNATDNVTAFANAEASPAQRIYLNEGIYYTTTPASSLAKLYYGPGRIRTSGGDNVPGRFTYLNTRPTTGTGSGFTKFFTADNAHVEPEYFVLGDVRTGLTESYYEAATTPHLEIFDNRAGYSGTTARLTAIAALGATSATLNSAAGFTVGGQIGFNDGNDNITNTRTITSIVGNVVSWTAPLVAPAPYAVGYRVTKGIRTMCPQHHYELQHRGGGDSYIHMFRVEASYSPTAGQDHVFFTGTAGIDGGDMVASSSGVYLTGREVTFDDQGNDVAVAGDVRTFLRANGTAAREAFWIGTLYASAGAQSADAAVSVAGPWKVGVDLARGDFSSNGNCAVGLKSGHRIYFDNAGSSTKLYENWGSVLGTRSSGYDTTRTAWTYKVGSVNVLNLADNGTVYGDAIHTAPANATDAAKLKQFIASGVYTPTLTNGANVAASTAFECQWLRVGNVVHVTGQCQIDPTAASTPTILGVSLPIPSALAFGRQASGTATSDEVAGLSGRVFGDVANARAQLVFITADTANRTWGFTFSYLIA